MSIRCPVCGTVLQPELIPAARNSFTCPRCRTELDVAASDPVPLLAVSVVLSFGLCVVLELRGLALILAIIVLTATFYGLGKLVRDIIAAPKLERSRSGDKLLRQPGKLHQI